MVISRTPYRISFFGGGTDYPAWSREHGGAVLVSTIDKYCYLTCRYLPPFFDHRIRVVYSYIENCLTVDEIRHPAARAVLKHLGMERGVEIHHDGDLPARSGMGSSSAFTVGLLHALHALLGRMPSKHQLAAESIHVEQDIIRETVGSQDQVATAHGGLNYLRFFENGEFAVQPVTIAGERLTELNDHLMLFYTGIKRTASDVAASYVEDLASRARQMHATREMADEGLRRLTGGGDLTAFGELLHEAWLVKRSLSSKVAPPAVDALYDRARAAGAIGGKVTGAGGGGFLLLFVPPERHAAVRAALADRIHVPFRFEFSGSQIIFYDMEQDYAALDRQRLDGIPAPSAAAAGPSPATPAAGPAPA